MDRLAKHIPVVLLILWVALTFFIRMPWCPTAPADTKPEWHKVLLLSDGLERPKTLRYEAVILDSAGQWSRWPEMQLYLLKDSTRAPFRAGDMILLHDSLCGQRAVVRNAALLLHDAPSQLSLGRWRLRLYAIRLRASLEARINRHVRGAEEQALIASIVLGDRRYLSADQRAAFQDAGAMHILAVSGMHVGLINSIIVWILTLGGWLYIPWEKKGLRILQRVCVLVLLWSYALLTGLSTPVVRTSLMFSMVPLLRSEERLYIRLNRLAMAALIILVLNPMALFSPAFLLSFSAVLAIMLCGRWSPRGKAGKLLFTSLAAQLGTMPWTIVFFRQVAVYFFVTSMWIIPMALVMMGLTLAALLVGEIPFSDSLADILFRATEWVARIMNIGVRWIQSWPGAVVYL